MMNKADDGSRTGGILLNEYKETQIIKHALKYYIDRPGTTEKERAQEKRLFHKFSEKASAYKNKFGIK